MQVTRRTKRHGKGFLTDAAKLATAAYVGNKSYQGAKSLGKYLGAKAATVKASLLQPLKTAKNMLYRGKERMQGVPAAPPFPPKSKVTHPGLKLKDSAGPSLARKTIRQVKKIVAPIVDRTPWRSSIGVAPGHERDPDLVRREREGIVSRTDPKASIMELQRTKANLKKRQDEIAIGQKGKAAAQEDRYNRAYDANLKNLATNSAAPDEDVFHDASDSMPTGAGFREGKVYGGLRASRRSQWHQMHYLSKPRAHRS
jgi:hypothetical protein